MTIYNEPPPGMCIVPDKEDITEVSNFFKSFFLFLFFGFAFFLAFIDLFFNVTFKTWP